MANTEVFTGLTSEQADKLEAQYKALGYTVVREQENGSWKITASLPDDNNQ
jgi:hypothetical protein